MTELIKDITPELTVIGAITLIQIAPIKINPWSWLIKMLQKILGTYGLKTEIETINKRLGSLESKTDDNEKLNITILRSSIISDYTNLKNGVAFDETAYQEIFRKYDMYKKLLEDNDMENGYLDDLMEEIKRMHHNSKGGSQK